MIDVFISYKRERRKVAAHLADVLRLYGYNVWFDYGLVKGKDFGDQLDAKINEAKAVVVLWCSKAVDSKWVAREASLAEELEKLAPVRIEPCRLKLQFRDIDTLDISAWNTMPRDHVLDALLDTVGDKVGRALNFDLKAVREFEDRWRRSNIRKIADFADEAPDPAITEDARLITPSGFGNGGATAAETMLSVAAREWPAVRDGRNTARLARFEGAFAGTYFAGEAQALREEIEAEARAEAEARRARELAERYKGRIHLPNVIAHGAPDGWFLPGAGKTEWFQDFAGGPEMVVVPDGAFTMGSPENEPERNDDEGQQHDVTIPKPFAVGRFAVTRGEFAAFAAATNHKTEGGAYVFTGTEWVLDPKKSWRDPGFAQDDSHPVVCVNWEDAQTYIKWLNDKVQGPLYRLPSEAEWEYVCRAKTVTPFWWGSAISPKQANYNGNVTYAGGGSKGDYLKKTLPVKSFEPNPWGLYHIHSNVWEWCADCWNNSYKDKPDPLKQTGEAWTTGDCALRVIRGGSWSNDPGILRSAYRSGFYAGYLNNILGFRVARTFWHMPLYNLTH